MTLEEITRTLQTVAENQQLTAQCQMEPEATAQEIAQFHEQVLRNYKARQAMLEASFRQVRKSSKKGQGKMIKARPDAPARRDTRHTSVSRRRSPAPWGWSIRSRSIHQAHALRPRVPDRNGLRAAAADRR
jgi:hypothetical protein